MMKQLIKTIFVAVMLLSVIVVAAAAADRAWQKGTWTQVGVARTPFVADVVHERMPPGFNKPQMTEVATYVIETKERRYDLQDTVAIGSNEFERIVKIGGSVTFAIEKRTAYIQLDEGEYRLLVVKNERRKAR
jgi:hypothetical protein